MSSRDPRETQPHAPPGGGFPRAPPTARVQRPPAPPSASPPSSASSPPAYPQPSSPFRFNHGGNEFFAGRTGKGASHPGGLSPPARAMGGAAPGPQLPSAVSFREPAALSPPPPLQSTTGLLEVGSKDSLGYGLTPAPSGSSTTGLNTMPVLNQVPSSDLVAGPSDRAADGFRFDPEQSGFSANRPDPEFKRKRSLVRPDRERMDPSHRQWYYRNHAAQMEAAASPGGSRLGYMPSNTGHLPQHGALPSGGQMGAMGGPGGGISGLGLRPGLPGAPNAYNLPPGGLGRGPGGATGMRRGKSILGREEDRQLETAINVLKRGVSIRRHQPDSGAKDKTEVPRDLGEFKPSSLAPGPVDAWMIYAFTITCCIPPALMKMCGIKTPEQRRAWREKIGLLGVVMLCMTFVGFLTFGFTQTVCGKPGNRYVAGTVDAGSSIVHGIEVDMNDFFHPQVGPFGANTMFNHTNPAYSDPWLSGGRDISLLFQKVDGKCSNFITLKAASALEKSPAGGPANYFPCTILNQNSSRVWYTGNSRTEMCHPASVRTDFANKLHSNNQKAVKSQAGFKNQGTVYYTWQNLTNPTRNLVTWKNTVLDLDRLQYLDKANLNYPAFFDQLYPRNTTWASRDISSTAFKLHVTKEFDCLEQMIGVGQIDSQTIGCVASQVELYLSLVFILGVVLARFFMAVLFGWCLSWRLGAYGKNQTAEQRKRRREEIEAWSSDIYRPAPARYRPNAKKTVLKKPILPHSSRFSHANANKASVQARLASEKLNSKGLATPGASTPGGITWDSSHSSFSEAQHGLALSSGSGGQGSRCPFPLVNVVPQPAADFMPFGFTLAHSICLVTAYSESFEGLRTTLDSLATTDYPNSHKFLLVIADGIVKGDGSDLSTPDICLSMMKDLIVPAEDVEGHSYVAIADGAKRHNMAKIYAGFYDYDNATVERSKQQRVPMILVAKCGSPLEADSAKPGNRGKRDSQVLLMAFLQKVMFDERMTTFEYEFFNAIWRTTGVPPDKFEIILMVDADTKVFPDSLSRMVSCMVEDTEIMGLCGETKIANKSDSWVTMIQVFEYYISHHSQKACEACFGGVTCLPGCFSAYRIKAPKGPNGYWVPILANPDIVEHYSENVVDTLHKKNLLLLGEDRYLTTLMLKTFPKRKMMFVPQAVCKTIVPDTFKVLLSQRRRWINSTVHNLFELVLVNELCGVFCLSMRFMIAMELVGTLVLPAALAFTFYVAVIAIVHAFTHDPIPVIPLVLLAVILGLPGVLIVVTSRKWSYVGWMLIYLVSLPMWNLILPSYAFWHFDDFSWGATRVVQGEGKKGGDHSGAEGHFDPSHIVMKRWADFERERRLRCGIESRGSMYDVVHRSESVDPDQTDLRRYSMASADTYHSSSGDGSTRPTAALLHQDRESLPDDGVPGQKSTARQRLDNVPLLELPAPLAPDAANRRGASPAHMGSIQVPRPPRDPSPLGNTSHLPPTTSAPAYGTASSLSPGAPGNPFAEHSPAMLQAQQQARQARTGGAVPPPTPPGVPSYPSQPSNIPYASPDAARPDGQLPLRGVSLVDDGPVPSSEGMRTVQRGSKRQSQIY